MVCSFLLLSLAGCTLSNNQAAPSTQPGPQLNSNLSPASVIAGSAGFSLTVTGSNFTTTCVVLWNGSQRATQILSSTQAVATISAADVATAGTAMVSVLDTITGLESSPVAFIITVSQPVQHTVTLTWQAGSPNTAGYNVYRGTVSGGPYTRINMALQAATSYVDNTVQAGDTYFYAATSVDSTGRESAFSNQVTAVIPTP